jgi:hypothetical protein
MPKHIETILTSVGLPAEEVQKIMELPEADQEKFDAKPFADKVKENYQKQFQNDPAFFEGLTMEKLPPQTQKKLKDDSFGRAANVVKDKLLKGLGMTEADYADLPDEQKEKIESLIPAIVERYTKTKSGAKEVQEELIKARKELEKYGPDYEKTLESKYETQANQKVTSAIFNAALIGELSSIQGLKIPAGDIAATANNILQSKYSFERVGDYNVELRQKANPQMKVLKANSSHEMTLKDALLEIATERGWIEVKDDDSGKGSGTVNIKPNGKGELTMYPPHLRDQISKKIAAEK